MSKNSINDNNIHMEINKLCDELKLFMIEMNEKIRINNENMKKKEQQIKRDLDIDIIYHLGDIHIPGNIDRELEYEQVLNRTIEIISKEKRKKITVICGDLFHDKTKPYQEANILARDFMKGLGDICETIIIQGNHDVNIDNENRKDSIKSTLRKLETKYPIHYLTENQIYKIQGINFGLTKMTNDKVTPIKYKNPFELYIGLYHGTLYKSKTDDGYEFNDIVKIKASDFKDYDIVMLGDIHKYQYLNSEKTIAYSGSLIQQNYGESINEHGILLWDLRTKQSNLIPIPNDYIFKTHQIDINGMNDYTIPDIENKICRLKIQYKGVDRVDLLNYEKEIKSKYNIIQLIKQELVDDDVITKKSNDNCTINKKFMEVYLEYLQKNNIKENEKATEELIKMVEEEQKKIVEIKREIKLHEIEFENLITYGTGNKIKFDKLNGINILTGTNGIGKSSLIDIILFTIYNKFSREGKGKDALNIRHKKGYSILKLELNGEKYTIFRGINKEKTEAYLFQDFPDKDKIFDEISKIKSENKKDSKDNKNNIKNNSDDGKKDIDKQIITLFGKYDDMVMTSIILQVGQQFIDLKASEKKNKLIEFFGLNSYDVIFKKIETLYNTCIRSDIPKIKKELKNINYEKMIMDIEVEKTILEKELENINKNLIDITKEKTILEYSNQNYHNDIDITIMTNNKIQIEQKIIKIKNDLVNYKNNYLKLDNQIQLDNSEMTLTHYKNILINNKNSNQEQIILSSKKIKTLNGLGISLGLGLGFNSNVKTLENQIQILKQTIENNLMEIEDNINKHELTLIKINLIKTIFENSNDIKTLLKFLENDLTLIKEKEQIHNQIKNSLSIHNQNNKYLLAHKFNNNCECCIFNNQIHKEIGYMEKITQLENELIINNFQIEEKTQIENKIKKIKEYFDLEQILTNIKTQIYNLNEKKQYNLNKLDIINDSIKILIENEKYQNEINLLENENKLINEKIKILDLIILSTTETNRLEEKLILTIKKINEYNGNIVNYEKYKNILIQEKKLLDKKTNYEIDIKKHIIKLTQLNNEFTIEKENLNKLKILTDNEKILNYIHTLFKSGFIEYIISYKLNILINKMNNILRNLGNYEITTEMNTEGIVFYKIKDDETKLNVLKLCGYERIIFNIGLRLALNSMNLYYKNNFMVIDEGFSAADNINIHKFQNIMAMIEKDYDICILISHIDEIKNTRGRIMKINYNPISKDSHIYIC